jgi:hypothetical protein
MAVLPVQIQRRMMERVLSCRRIAGTQSWIYSWYWTCQVIESECRGSKGGQLSDLDAMLAPWRHPIFLLYSDLICKLCALHGTLLPIMHLLYSFYCFAPCKAPHSIKHTEIRLLNAEISSRSDWRWGLDVGWSASLLICESTGLWCLSFPPLKVMLCHWRVDLHLPLVKLMLLLVLVRSFICKSMHSNTNNALTRVYRIQETVQKTTLLFLTAGHPFPLDTLC